MYNDHHFLRAIKQYKFLFGVLLFISVCIVIFLFVLNRTTNLPTPEAPTPDITPGIARNNLTVLTITPKNNSKNISIYPKIEIAFSRGVESFEKSEIIFTATPAIKAKPTWSVGQNILLVEPEEALIPDQFYVATVRYYDQIFTWSFTTTPLAEVSTKDQIKAQSVADQNYGEAVEKLDRTYPWLQRLPLQTDTYFVYFDPGKKQLIALLYPKTSTQIAVDDQVALMKTEILRQLGELEIDINKYPPIWKSTPEQ